MKMLAAPALLLLLQTHAAPQALEVQLQTDNTRVRAEAIPLARVLEEMAHRGNWDLEFIGARPEKPVTVDIEAGSEAEALLQLFEGLPVTYAAGFDESGMRVRKLIVVAAGVQRLGGRPPAANVRSPGSERKVAARGGGSRSANRAGQDPVTRPVSPSAASYPRRPGTVPGDASLTPPAYPAAASYPRRPGAAPGGLTPPAYPAAASYSRR